MNVYDVLQEPGVRISTGSRWLVFDEGTYTVYEHAYGAKNVTIVYEGGYEDVACMHLIADN